MGSAAPVALEWALSSGGGGLGWDEKRTLGAGDSFIRAGVETTVGAGEMRDKGVSPVVSSHLVNCCRAYIVSRCIDSWGGGFRILFYFLSLPSCLVLLSLG